MSNKLYALIRSTGLFQQNRYILFSCRPYFEFGKNANSIYVDDYPYCI